MTPNTPSGLTRWDIAPLPSNYGPGPKKWTDPSGEWVRYSDVASLEERCKRLESATQALREAASEAWNTMHSTAYALRDDEDREHLVARLENAQRSLSEAMWNKELCAALSEKGET